MALWQRPNNLGLHLRGVAVVHGFQLQPIEDTHPSRTLQLGDLRRYQVPCAALESLVQQMGGVLTGHQAMEQKAVV